MKSLPLIAIVLASSAAGGGVATLAARPQAKESPEVSSAAFERLNGTVAGLAARQDSLDRSLEEMHALAELAPVGDTRVAISDIEAAVARWMEESRGEGAGRVSGEDEPVEVSREERVAQALALLDGDLSDAEVQGLWRELAEEGLTGDIIAAFEARAEANPNDPDAQVELGGVYLQKIFEVGNSPEAGLWATKADGAFDRALELDERHWDARFSKAVSLSFWPPVFGKQGEAIQHFEVLVSQQEGLAGEPRHVQTHVLLGNMYQQIGEREKALGVWRYGLELFPDEESLLGQIEAFGGQ